MYARLPELLGHAAHGAYEVRIRWKVQSNDDALAQVCKNGDARRVAIAIYMPEKSVLNDK